MRQDKNKSRSTFDSSSRRSGSINREGTSFGGIFERLTNTNLGDPTTDSVLISTGGGQTSLSPPTIIRHHGRHRYRAVRADEADKRSTSLMCVVGTFVHLATHSYF